jgi:hypothetical protein
LILGCEDAVGCLTLFRDPDLVEEPLPAIFVISAFIGFQIMFLARLEGASLSKAYRWYVVEGQRLITQPKNFIWKAIAWTSDNQHWELFYNESGT